MREQTSSGPRRVRWIPWATACLACFVVGLLVASGLNLPRRSAAAKFWTEGAPVPAAQGAPAPDPRERPPSFVELARRLQGTVVNISTTKAGTASRRHPDLEGRRDPWGDFFERFFGQPRTFRGRSLGSGVIVNEAGYILTNAHVVEQTTEILVRLSDRHEFPATLVGRDGTTDLALIKIAADQPLGVATLGDSDALQIGEWVLAIGNPFGFEHSVTAGIVSGKGRDLGASAYDQYIQTDAAINPGNSGGPLVNTRGEVVGINTAIIPNSHIGFAIPINLAKTILVQLKDQGRVTRAWLGVLIQPVPREAAGSLGLSDDRGALVSEVVADSPAAAAGMHAGDVIVALDGKPVAEARELPRLVAGRPVGSTVEVTFLRGGKRRTVRLTLGELPEERVAARSEEEGGLGLTVRDVTPDLARELGLSGATGVAITAVEPGTEAERAGLKRGDRILEVNRRSVASATEVREALTEAGRGGAILLLVRRGERSLFAALKAPAR
ncbi:MAG TPA: DegQ family serine endoprotease [Candidatus Methylomirabilis sp.]|jgi:serine protease Do|nr:DegQ family serine endoprotease [Candidatus Methylomirabilis sp.]